ncbi:MAG: ribokinase [Marinovum sp.]|jgi:ribokinase|nr:ribokinase [Marinovum sp.]|tara:strand:- start:452 stop:1357 length:906 start_codon:yes stop_codon:yes gene_type:complete
MAGKILVVGSLHLDVIVHSSRLPKPDETLLGDKVSYRFGGKGGNQALAAAKIDVQVFMAGRIGTDNFGKQIYDTLSNQNINLDGLKIVDEATGMSVALIGSDGIYSAVVVSGVNQTIELSEIAVPDDLTVLVLQNEINTDANFEIIKKVPKSTFVILNAAPALTPNKDFFERIDLLIVNQLEAKMLLNEEPSIFNNLDALRKLQNLGPKEVIITLGAEGYTGISKNGEIFSEPGIKVDVLSTHGAGDSFVGTLAAFICKGEPINIAAQYAQASSALHVKTPIDQREKILQADIENMFSLNQ